MPSILIIFVSLFQRIRDAQLIGIVLVMNIVIVAIVIVWESTGPHTVVVKESAKDVGLEKQI